MDYDITRWYFQPSALVTIQKLGLPHPFSGDDLARMRDGR